MTNETYKNNGPIVAIGFDGADPLIIEKLMSEGKMPILSRIKREGCWGRLTREGDLFSDSVWINFVTGVGESYHGMVSWAQLEPKTYNLQNTSSNMFYRHKLPFYARFTDSNRRVAIVDVPKTRAFKKVKGAQVFAWGAHSHQYYPSSVPSELYREIENRFGKFSMRDRDSDDRNDNEYYYELLNCCLKSPIQKSKMCTYIHDKYKPLDLLLTIFSEPHSIGHKFYHFMDETHPNYDLDAPEDFKNAIYDTYEACDKAVGEILNGISSYEKVIVFSIHGMGQNAHDVASLYLLPEFLYRFSFPDQEKDENKSQGGIIQTIRKLLPHQFRNYIKHYFPLPVRAMIFKKRIEQIMFKKYWPKMKAFALHTASTGYIRFNLKGREPHGIVDPNDYDHLCDELTEHLMNLVETRTGKPAVQKVHRRRENHPGPQAESVMPDLFVEWADLYIESIYSPRFGEIGPVPNERSGTHRPRGIFFAQGAGITPGKRIDGCHAKDITPTIISWMNEPIHDDIEGRIIPHDG